MKKNRKNHRNRRPTNRQDRRLGQKLLFSREQPEVFGTPKGDGPGYQVGDRVHHVKFGDGTVTAMIEGGRDYEVTVDFDGPGTKKMFAAFAKLQKID